MMIDILVVALKFAAFFGICYGLLEWAQYTHRKDMKDD